MSRIPRPTKSQLSSFLYLFVATTLILAPLLAPVINGHSVRTDHPRVFLSDDTDSGSAIGSLTDFGDEDYATAESDANSAGERADYTFDNTHPVAEFESETVVYDDWRRNELATFNFQKDQSRGPIYTCIPRGAYEVTQNSEGDYDPDNSTSSSERNKDCRGTQEPDYGDEWVGYMKDTQTTILGVEGGTEMNYRRMPPASDQSYRFRPILSIPPNGELYVHSDFRYDRSEIIDYDCKEPDWEYTNHTHDKLEYEWNEQTKSWETYTTTYSERHKVDGEKTCVTQEFTNESVLHTAKLTGPDGTKTIGTLYDDDLAGGTIDYSNAERQEKESMFIESEFTFTIKTTTMTKDWDQGSGWETVAESSETENRTNEYTSRRVTVDTMSNKDITVEQTVVNIENYDQTYLVIDINGPDNLEDRRLWSRMYLGECNSNTPYQYRTCDQNQYISNTWGVYSSRQYDHIRKKTSDGDFKIHKPYEQFVSLHTTTIASEPKIRVANPEQASTRARIQSSETTQPFGNVAPVLRNNVNITQAPPTIVHEISIKGAPGKVNRIEDLHGDPISVSETREVPGRVPNIYLNDQDNQDVKITVEDPETGEPLSNRRVRVDGAEESVVYTNSTGEVVVSRDSSFINVRTQSDDFEDDKDVYYVSAVNERTYFTNPVIMGLVFDFVRAVIYASPFIGLYMWLKHMRDGQDD